MEIKPLAVAFVVAACCLALTSCTSGNEQSDGTTGAAPAATVPSQHSSVTAAPAAPTRSTGPTAPVHIKLLNGDGQQFGVGMPEIAYFSRKITSAKALQAATTVTVDGRETKGAWYFESSAAGNGPVEGHFRLPKYWPAHAEIAITIAAKGLSAGPGLVFDNSLTSTWTTGRSNVATVDDGHHELTLDSDGEISHFPVSLGAAKTPTALGTKVIMEKGVSICMHGPGYHECGVRYTQRLTYGGEYLHSAPWNCTGEPGCVGPRNNIGSGNSSNGCTNLLPHDAKLLYGTLEIGDVVTFPNADGPRMSLGAGYGDWNLNWSQWLTGGLVPTT